LTPLTEKDAGEYALPLEMLRLAPSATNKQPWRVVQSNNAYHFYEEQTAGYSDDGRIDIQRVDVGISLCHFHLTALERNLTGKLETRPQQNIVPSKNTHYIISWTPEK